MKQLVLDSSACAQVKEGGYPVEVCDEEGKPFAVLVPTDFYREMMDLWLKETFTNEDIEQARAEVREQGGYSTPEVLARLQEMIKEARAKS